MKFCSFASGSAGNCYYIASGNSAILIDAGISARAIRNSLKSIDTGLDSIYGIFVTHDHFDHTYGLGLLGERYNVPVYSTAEVLAGYNRCVRQSIKLSSCRRYVQKGVSVAVGDFSITPFHLDHDASDCVGYYIEAGGSSLAVATDLGFINDDAAHYLLKADNIVIEANYSEQMLMEGPYPVYLKQRILSSNGHLANHVTAKFLASHADRHCNNVFFCHLSNNNNTPDKVIEEIHAAFDLNGVRENLPVLHTLPRRTMTGIFEF